MWNEIFGILGFATQGVFQKFHSTSYLYSTMRLLNIAPLKHQYSSSSSSDNRQNMQTLQKRSIKIAMTTLHTRLCI